MCEISNIVFYAPSLHWFVSDLHLEGYGFVSDHSNCHSGEHIFGWGCTSVPGFSCSGMCLQALVPEFLLLLPRGHLEKGAQSEKEPTTCITEEARAPWANILLCVRDRRWTWRGHKPRIAECRLVRKVHLNCVKAEKESSYGDITNLGVESNGNCKRWRKVEWT